MAASHSDYKRGDMEISAQSHTFNGFMAATIYGGSAIIVGLLFPILVFAANFNWFPSLVATVVVAILIGIGLKLKGAWYASVIGIAIVAAALCALIGAFI